MVLTIVYLNMAADKDFENPEIGIEIWPQPGWIAVEADDDHMRLLPEGSTAEVQVMDETIKMAARNTLEVSPQVTILNVVLNATSLPAKD